MVHKLNIRVFLAAKNPWLWFSYTFWCHLTYSYRFFWYHKNWRFYLCLLLNFQKNAKIQSLIKASNFWNISKFNKNMTNLNIFCKEKAYWVLQKQKNAKGTVHKGRHLRLGEEGVRQMVTQRDMEGGWGLSKGDVTSKCTKN